ncbi:MAG: sulfatase-like hydrolase/transferase [Bacilli bacterium]|nr:sulfatase-like hydrolase/transferase [Bacilli bacterium]
MKKKKLTMLIWWVFWFVYLEFIFRAFVIGNLFTLSTLIVLLFCIPWVIVLHLLLNLFNEKVNRILNIVFSGFLCVLTLTQYGYYKIYDSIFSFFSLTAGGAGQAMQFWERALKAIIKNWYVFALGLIPYILFLIFNKKIFSFKRIKLPVAIFEIILLIVSITGICLSVYFDNSGIYSLKRLLFETHAPMITIEKIGLNNMETIDVYRYMFGFEEEIYIDDEENDVEVELNKEKEYNVYEIDFDDLISKTKDKKLISMHKYFKSVEPTEKNKYSGLFKGKNLVFITAEAFDPIALDPELTPTLYKIANNSFVFTNYYQPLYPVSTSDGEYMNLTGLIPKEGVWSLKRSGKNSMPFGLGTKFKAAGYLSYAFHDHHYKYYDRHISHPNLGFTYLGCGNGLQKKMNCSHWPNSDKEMMDATIDYYLNKGKPFATYYMTVSGHLNYNFYGNNMAYRNKDAVKNLKYSDAVKAYIATHIEVDKAMNKLISELEKAGVLDDTLIVMACDHYPYGLTYNELNEVSKTNRKDKFENYHSTLIMYNPSIEKTVINKVVAGIDLLPTIYNLFGIDYDSRLIMGKDIFSDTEGLAILSDRSWVSDKGTYNNVTKKFTKKIDEDVSQEYIDKMNKVVNQKFTMSSLILDYNYYKKLGIK